MSYKEGTAFRPCNKDFKMTTLGALAKEKGRKNQKEKKTRQICASPNCEIALTQSKFLCPTCSKSAFEEFWSLLLSESDKSISSCFIQEEFSEDEWRNYPSIVQAFNFAKLRLKDAKSIKNEQDIANWGIVLKIMQDVLQKFGVEQGN